MSTIPPTPISAATAIADFTAGVLTAGTAISDTAANITANIDALESIADAGDLGAIRLTDPGTPSITVTSSQLTLDGRALAAINGSYIALVTTAAPNVTILSVLSLEVVAFGGTANEYSVVPSGHAQGVTVTDIATGRSSVDQIDGVEFLQFADRMLFVTTQEEAQIALLYQGTLGRTPDVYGLVGWQRLFATLPGSVLNADNFTSLAGTPIGGLPNLAYGFTESVEFQQKYGPLSDSQFVTQLYANVLDRTPDQPGLNGWVGALAQGHTREWVLVGFVESPEAYHNAELGYVGQTGTVHAPWLMVS